MNLSYHGKEYTVLGFARSTVLPEEFILMQGHGEILAAPTHDLSGIKSDGVPLNDIKGIQRVSRRTEIG